MADCGVFCGSQFTILWLDQHVFPRQCYSYLLAVCSLQIERKGKFFALLFEGLSELIAAPFDVASAVFYLTRVFVKCGGRPNCGHVFGEVHKFRGWKVNVRISRVQNGLSVLVRNIHWSLVSDFIRRQRNGVVVLIVVDLEFCGRGVVCEGFLIKASKLNG